MVGQPHSQDSAWFKIKRAFFSLEFLRFVTVGASGFVIDGGIMSLAIASGISHIYARIFSFPVAVCVTWLLNRIWTFSKSDKSQPVKQLRRYFAVQVLGALTNFAVFAGLLEIFEPTPLNIFASFTIGSAVGLIVNYLGSKKLVY